MQIIIADAVALVNSISAHFANSTFQIINKYRIKKRGKKQLKFEENVSRILFASGRISRNKNTKRAFVVFGFLTVNTS